MKKENFVEINLIKGICILMIMIIHSLSPGMLKSELPMLNLISNSFALSLFFIVSGFLYHHDDTPLKIFFKKKVSRLLLPYVFFASMDILLRFIFSSYTNNPDNNNLWIGIEKILTGRVYWFLFSLFSILLVNRIVGRRFRPIFMLVCFVLSLSGLCETNMFCIKRSLYYNLFFSIGYFIQDYYPKLKDVILRHKLKLLLTSFLFYVCFLLLNRTGYLLQISGCIFIWILCLTITSNRILLHFGKYSMQYYTIHLLICFLFYPVGKIVFNYTNSYLLYFLTILICIISMSFIGLTIEKKIKPMYPIWGL